MMQDAVPMDSPFLTEPGPVRATVEFPDALPGNLWVCHAEESKEFPAVPVMARNADGDELAFTMSREGMVKMAEFIMREYG